MRKSPSIHDNKYYTVPLHCIQILPSTTAHIHMRLFPQDPLSMNATNLYSAHSWKWHIIMLNTWHSSSATFCSYRPGKFSNCAHFTLRCRRKLADGQFQLPLVALAFNFESEKLSPFQARTVFHELGHAMHSILCETQFQHLAGRALPSLLRSP